MRATTGQNKRLGEALAANEPHGMVWSVVQVHVFRFRFTWLHTNAKSVESARGGIFAKVELEKHRAREHRRRGFL